jgi:hypothetical protein
LACFRLNHEMSNGRIHHAHQQLLQPMAGPTTTSITSVPGAESTALGSVEN